MIETYQSTHLKSFFEWRRRRWECVARGPKAFKWSFDLAREFLRELFPFYLIDYRTLRPAPFRWWVGGWLVDRRLSIMYLVFVCCQPQNVLYVCKMIGFVFQTVEFSLDRFSCRLNICIWFWSLFECQYIWQLCYRWQQLYRTVHRAQCRLYVYDSFFFCALVKAKLRDRYNTSLFLVVQHQNLNVSFLNCQIGKHVKITRNHF